MANIEDKEYQFLIKDLLASDFVTHGLIKSRRIMDILNDDFSGI